MTGDCLSWPHTSRLVQGLYQIGGGRRTIHAGDNTDVVARGNSTIVALNAQIVEWHLNKRLDQAKLRENFRDTP